VALTQLPVAFGAVQDLPQLPQLPSWERLTSQPSAQELLQFA
jgi:hypothetical protein